MDYPLAVSERERSIAATKAADKLICDEEAEPDRQLAAEITPASRQHSTCCANDPGGARPSYSCTHHRSLELGCQQP
jgi:hypothetical protein